MSVLLLAWSPTWAHDGPTTKIAELTLKLARGGDPADLFLQRAGALFRLGRFRRAHGDLDRARNAGATDTAQLRAQIYAAQGEHRMALETLAPLADTEDFAIQLLRARILAQLGHYENAMNAYKIALKTNTSVECVAEAAATAVSLGRSQEASAILEKGLKDHANAAVLAKARFDLALQSGDIDRAVAIADIMVSSSRVPAAWLRRRAAAKQKSGDAEAAHKDLLQALETANLAINKRRSPLMLVVRAQVQLDLKNRQAALKDVRAAQSIAPAYQPAGDLLVTLEQRL